MSDLPIETELIDGWYQTAEGRVCRYNSVAASVGDPSLYFPSDSSLRPAEDGMVRLEPAAVYRNLPAEPLGLGAVVKDAKGYGWVRVDRSGAAWCKTRPNDWKYWGDIAQPVTVLSEGVADV